MTMGTTSAWGRPRRGSNHGPMISPPEDKHAARHEVPDDPDHLPDVGRATASAVHRARLPAPVSRLPAPAGAWQLADGPLLRLRGLDSGAVYPALKRPP